MRDNPVEQIVSDIMNRRADISPEARTVTNSAGRGITEFVGTTLGHTIGLVIANVDNQLYEVMNIDKEYRSTDILGARTGVNPQTFAADEAIKATNNEIISIELARDTGGGGGYGRSIIFGVSDVSDVRRAVEVALPEIERTMDDVYSSSAGHLEFQHIVRTSYALNKTLDVSIGKSFGIICASSVAIGLMIADVAAKLITIDPVGYASSSQGISFNNEVILTLSDGSGAVRQAVIVTREAGLQLSSTLDSVEIKPTTTSYI